MKKREFDEGTIGNIVPPKHELPAKLIACKCPYCNTIFTLEFSNKFEFKHYHEFKDKCPTCGNRCNWLIYQIPIFWYKWLRWVRSRGENEST